MVMGCPAIQSQGDGGGIVLLQGFLHCGLPLGVHLTEDDNDHDESIDDANLCQQIPVVGVGGDIKGGVSNSGKHQESRPIYIEA